MVVQTQQRTGIDTRVWTAQRCAEEQAELVTQHDLTLGTFGKVKGVAKLIERGYSQHVYEIDPVLALRLTPEQRYVLIGDWINYGATVTHNRVTIYVA